MQQASFSLKNYIFNKTLIDLKYLKNDELNIEFDINGIFTIKSKIYELNFTTNISNEKKEEPFAIISCAGFFEFENIKTFEDIPDYFYRNSIAILFPYVRAYLSMITTQSNTNGIILPTLNLSDLYHDLKSNTKSI